MIKEIENLFNSKNYEEVIKLASSSNEYEDRIFLLSSYIQLRKYKEALNEIKTHRNLYESHALLKTMKIHFELLFELSLWDEATEEKKYYENLPYESQEVEEFLNGLEKTINEAKTFNFAPVHYSNEEIIDTLMTKTNFGELSNVLFALKDYNILKLLDGIEHFMTREDVHPNLRTYALIMLVDAKINKNVVFLSRKGNIIVNPSVLTPPFNSKLFFDVIDKVKIKCNQNPSLSSVAISLFNNYLLDIYPDDSFNYSADLYCEALIDLASEYLSTKQDCVLSYEASTLKEMIKEVIESTPIIEN